MAQERLRLGIVGANVGYGWGGRAHVPALLALPEYELRAICTAHRETAEEAARQFGVPLSFDDYHQMVQHPEIDVVSVSVRVPSHHAIVMAALEAGKHVFCEWPLGANTDQAREMASLARSKGVRNMAGLQARGSPAILRLKELMEEGFVGQAVACTMTLFLPGITRRPPSVAWMADRANGANAFTIFGGHAIDAFCFAVGEFREISAQVAPQVRQWHLMDTQQVVDVSSPDNVLISGVLESGAVASVHVANIPWHGSGWRVEVYGTEGTLVASTTQSPQLDDSIQLWGAKGTGQALERLEVPEHLSWVPAEVPKGVPFNVAQLFRRLAEGIGEGRQVEPSFDTALRRHQLLDTLEQSSAQGKRLPTP